MEHCSAVSASGRTWIREHIDLVPRTLKCPNTERDYCDQLSENKPAMDMFTSGWILNSRRWVFNCQSHGEPQRQRMLLRRRKSRLTIEYETWTYNEENLTVSLLLRMLVFSCLCPSMYFDYICSFRWIKIHDISRTFTLPLAFFLSFARVPLSHGNPGDTAFASVQSAFQLPPL